MLLASVMITIIRSYRGTHLKRLSRSSTRRSVEFPEIDAETLFLAEDGTTMLDEEWIRTLEDGRKVKFTELPDEVTFITAQIEGNKVVYSIILAKAKSPLSREEVESHFDGELSKK